MNYAVVSLRLYVAASVLTTCFISWTVPDGVAARVILQGQPIGYLFLAIATGLSGTAVLDSVINEAKWIPFDVPSTLKWRQLMFMLLSLISASIAFLVLNDRGYHPAVARYLLDSFASVAVAMLGLIELYRSSQYSHRVQAV